MSTMSIPLRDALKAYVDQKVNARGYGASGEYVCELIRKDQDVQRLREMLLDGAGSAATAPVDAGYFQDLRDRVAQRTGGVTAKPVTPRAKAREGVDRAVAFYADEASYADEANADVALSFIDALKRAFAFIEESRRRDRRDGLTC